ncbi:preprotein translocase subunit SecE [Patescibacteria group bacterium]|nr:preprotein translocase subunit SecE [Patescibacteria group bacterium]
MIKYHLKVGCNLIFVLLKMAITPITFLKEVRDELKKVVWPTRDEIIRLTTIVILVSLIVGVFLGGLDYIFTKLMELIIR